MNALSIEILEVFVEAASFRRSLIWKGASIVKSFSALEPLSTGCGYTVPTIRQKDLLAIHCELARSL